jgi:uncharacterized membrane protein YfcA
MSESLLVLIAFFSSALTAVIGLGGGILLVSLMPGLLPAAAVVPVHGVVQLASNASRALFGLAHVDWPKVWRFALGAVLGAALGAPLVQFVDERLLPWLLGGFILLVTWLPGIGRIRWPGRFVGVGALQTFVSLFVGAAGPLISPLLLREGLERDRLVVTHGAMMTALHGMKLVTFALLGFSYTSHARLLLAMVVSVTLGSWAGTRLRGYLPEKRFRPLFRLLLTLLALRLLASGVAAWDAAGQKKSEQLSISSATEVTIVACDDPASIRAP